MYISTEKKPQLASILEALARRIACSLTVDSSNGEVSTTGMHRRGQWTHEGADVVSNFTCKGCHGVWSIPQARRVHIPNGLALAQQSVRASNVDGSMNAANRTEKALLVPGKGVSNGRHDGQTAG